MRRRVSFLVVVTMVAALFLVSPQEIAPIAAYRVARRVHVVMAQVSVSKGNLIRVHGGRFTAEEVATVDSAAERALSILSRELGYKPTRPVNILLSDVTRGEAGSYSLGRISVQAPSTFDGDYATRGPVLHELTHLAVDYLAHGNYPFWLTEGLAVHMEAQHLEVLWLDIERPLNWGGLNALEQGFAQVSLLELENSYIQAFWVVDYLYSIGGSGEMQRLLRLLGRGETFDTALYRVYGLERRTLEEEVGVYLATRQEARAKGRILGMR